MNHLPSPITEPKSRSGSNTRQVLQRNVALYPGDIEKVEQIRVTFDRDSFSKAVRKAIELAMDHPQMQQEGAE